MNPIQLTTGQPKDVPPERVQDQGEPKASNVTEAKI